MGRHCSRLAPQNLALSNSRPGLTDLIFFAYAFTALHPGDLVYFNLSVAADGYTLIFGPVPPYPNLGASVRARGPAVVSARY